MSTNILIIFDNYDEADHIEDTLLENLGKDISVKVAGSESKAKEKLEKREYDLLVTNLHKTPLEAEEQRGLAFLQSLQEEGKKIPSILFLSAADEKLINAIKDLFRCEFVFENVKAWENDLIEKSKEILGLKKYKEEKREGERRLDIDVTLDLNKNSGECSFSGVNVECGFDRVTFAIDGKSMGKLVRRSKGIEIHPDWQDELQDIGEELMKQIFQNNPKVGPFLFTQAGKLGIGNIRIRFIVEKRVHPIALEALFGLCEISDDYWMLHAPIYRTVKEFPGLKAPLFWDPETRERSINCLIIEAYTTGTVDINHKKVTLKGLNNLKGECDFLENYLTGNRGKFNIGRIERIKEKREKKSFAETVKDMLKSDTWHLVHYAGHSYYDSDHDKGFVFFPEKFAEKMDISEFSKLLRDAKNQFIYLSSCHSSENDFVFVLASQNIPAIIGFRWDIDDNMAEKYSRSFYEHLFEVKRSLEYAFLESRKYMHDNYEKNIIWAAPMLIMQLKATR